MWLQFTRLPHLHVLRKLEILEETQTYKIYNIIMQNNKIMYNKISFKSVQYNIPNPNKETKISIFTYSRVLGQESTEDNVLQFLNVICLPTCKQMMVSRQVHL